MIAKNCAMRLDSTPLDVAWLGAATMCLSDSERDEKLRSLVLFVLLGASERVEAGRGLEC